MTNKNKVLLKGFPTQISEHIGLPDMAELLLYPPFFDTRIEDVYKYGTDFQRYLLDKSPLTHSKKHISVLCQVRLLVPNSRSCTGFSKTHSRYNEWHIDCEEKDNYSFSEERDIVHILTNQTTSMTEINKNEMVIDYNAEKEDLADFMDFMFSHQDRYPIIPQAMPANRIVTFTNHLHRATGSAHPEFKFMFRVVETNRESGMTKYDSHIHGRTDIFDGVTGKYIEHIRREKGKINIFLPSMDNSSYWKNKESK